MAEQPELNTARQSVTRNIYIYIYKCVLLKSEGRGIVDNTTERYAPVEKDDRTLVWDGRGSCRVILYVCVCVRVLHHNVYILLFVGPPHPSRSRMDTIAARFGCSA